MLIIHSAACTGYIIQQPRASMVFVGWMAAISSLCNINRRTTSSQFSQADMTPLTPYNIVLVNARQDHQESYKNRWEWMGSIKMAAAVDESDRLAIHNKIYINNEQLFTFKKKFKRLSRMDHEESFLKSVECLKRLRLKIRTNSMFFQTLQRRHFVY